MIYAVTDIETTGGHASGNGITEIAVILSDGKKIIDTFQSLIKPSVSIPPYISALTGITNEMVRRAPEFDDIADELFDFLNQGVFVAHNVNFDYSFIKESFSSSGIDWKPQRMCTVRLSKKAFPGMKSYGLENLCRQMEIRNLAAHRAHGDASATVELLHRCLEELSEKDVLKFVTRSSPEIYLPNNVSLEAFQKLPQVTGVYFLLDRQLKPLYIGKARNIRKRVQQHFSQGLESSKQQDFLKEIYNLDHILTGNELIALLLEDQEIRKHWPKHNRAQKRRPRKLSVMQYTDQNGFDRLAIYENESKSGAIKLFNNKSNAHNWLLEIADFAGLNHKLIGLPFELANEVLPDRLTHNQLLRDALKEAAIRETVYVILSEGRTKEEYGFIFTNQGSTVGYGFVPIDVQISKVSQWEEWLIPLSPSESTHGIINAYIEKPKGMKVLSFRQGELSMINE
ncbi:MAG: exonuclease domain-containing protein [Flavobacteriales bacterium]|nr:exonuclease domain-containing protein [Flavobacteriales bacterium]